MGVAIDAVDRDLAKNLLMTSYWLSETNPAGTNPHCSDFAADGIVHNPEEDAGSDARRPPAAKTSRVKDWPLLLTTTRFLCANYSSVPLREKDWRICPPQP